VSRDLVLAVDLGTSGLKVGLVSTHGEIVWWEHAPLRTAYGPDGAATQDAGAWWQLVRELSRRGVAEVCPEGGRVGAVCVTGQWASTVPTDADGHPVGPCVMWMDTRGARHSRAVVAGRLQGYRVGALATWVRRTAGVPSTSGADPLGHMLHLDRDQPEVAARARWYLEPVDHLSMRFTGVAAASPMSMTAAWLTDNRHLGVPAYDPTLVRMAGVDPRHLPPLVRSGTIVAPVQREVAADLGIGPGTPVVTGMPDLHAAAVGSGCLRPFEMHLSLGTSAWVSCPLPHKKTDVLRQMATVPGIDGSGYLLGNNQDSAGRCLEWFRDALARPVDGRPPHYREITADAATARAGAGGVIFTPWLTGERSPVDDRSARAGFHNVSVGTTHADLARAVLEGVAFNARWLLDGAEHFTGRPSGPLRLVGGCAQSDLWCQIVSDVCGRVVDRVADPLLAGLRGAALAAGLATGAVARRDVRDLVPTDTRFVPDGVAGATYARLFAEFPRLYRAERGTFRRLNGGLAR
jgi:xylulokinase